MDIEKKIQEHGDQIFKIGGAIKSLIEESQERLTKAGQYLVVSGMFFFVSMAVSIYPIVNNWNPVDVIQATKVSAIVTCFAVLFLIIAGYTLAKK